MTSTLTFDQLKRAEGEYILREDLGTTDEGYLRLIAPHIPKHRSIPGGFRYNPSILTLAAGVDSRNYDRGKSRTWTHSFLPWLNQEASYYSLPVPVHIRWGSPTQGRVFIIFGSSYSSWQNGTWMNKVISLLRDEYGEPHIIAFAGFLTPEFLQRRPRKPSLTVREQARDIYIRLRSAIDEWKRLGQMRADSEFGLIGFSGGASLAITLLSEDERQHEPDPINNPLIFGQGAIAFSPVLDLPSSYDVLDEANRVLDARGFPGGRALTTPVFPDFIKAFLSGYASSKPAGLLRVTAATGLATTAKRRELVSRFYREFRKVDLSATAEAVYPDALQLRILARKMRKDGSFGFSRYYRDTVFRYERSEGICTEEYDKVTTIGPELDCLKNAPLYIIFAVDDPVLAAVDPELKGTGAVNSLSSRLASIFQCAKRNPMVRLFAPARGGHMGYFLDTAFVRAILADFFGAQSPRRN